MIFVLNTSHFIPKKLTVAEITVAVKKAIFSIKINEPSNKENIEKNDPLVALKLTEKTTKVVVTK